MCFRNVSEDVVKGKEVSLLPEDLFTALDCCLDDTNKNVKLAAAIALYALERPNDRVNYLYIIYRLDYYICNKQKCTFSTACTYCHLKVF